MIRINPITLPVHHAPADLKRKVCALLRIPETELLSCSIVRRSVDARKKPEIFFTYMVDAEVRNEQKVLKKCRDKRAEKAPVQRYEMPSPGTAPLKERPVIIGTGPAGLFCGLSLAEAGYRPILLERGEPAEERKKTVERFWKEGTLDPESNVSFGEGGAGTFSDGKLNTMVKDPVGRNTAVLQTFVKYGADPEILWQQKPHVGTDMLVGIVSGIRKEIERLGGEVRFRTRAEHLVTEAGLPAEGGHMSEGTRVAGVRLSCGTEIPCSVLVAATGHSARDTFGNFLSDGVQMEAKAFAVGVRVQHPQHLIDLSQYGEKEAEFLSPAPYKLTAKSRDGRGVYTFCMCPGGYVVNASSEEGMTAVNGMSYHDRASGNANSALIVTVTPEDFGGDGPLAGIAYQRKLEERAFRAGKGKIPVQLYGDFREGKVSEAFGGVQPKFRGDTSFADLNEVLGPEVSEAVKDGMEQFGRKIKGFDRPDAVLAGVESRTSSPVRIPRDEHCEAEISGFYPCGEGAGYAGGITSAAMDGLRVAEQIIAKYALPAEV